MSHTTDNGRSFDAMKQEMLEWKVRGQIAAVKAQHRANFLQEIKAAEDDATRRVRNNDYLAGQMESEVAALTGRPEYGEVVIDLARRAEGYRITANKWQERVTGHMVKYALVEGEWEHFDAAAKECARLADELQTRFIDERARLEKEIREWDEAYGQREREREEYRVFLEREEDGFPE